MPVLSIHSDLHLPTVNQLMQKVCCSINVASSKTNPEEQEALLLEKMEEFLPKILTSVDYLILNGDIGNLASLKLFFKALRQKHPFLKILMVLGNHEFYGENYLSVKDDYRLLCRKYRVELLDEEINPCFIDEEHKILFVGNTLWSDFGLALDEVSSFNEIEKTLSANQKNKLNGFKYRISDFKLIKFGEKLFSIENIINQRIKCALSIQKHLEDKRFKEYKKVVITHFPPLAKETRHSRYGVNDIRPFFENNLKSLVEKADFWIFGHNHFNCDLSIKKQGSKKQLSEVLSNQFNENGKETKVQKGLRQDSNKVRVLSNQKGYWNEINKVGFYNDIEMFNQRENKKGLPYVESFSIEI